MQSLALRPLLPWWGHKLSHQQLLLLEDGHCLRDQALDVCHLAGALEKSEFQATSLETLRQMVAADVGVTLLPMLAGVPDGEARARAQRLIEALDVGHRMGVRVSMLSGGEQQRVAIARALVNRPQLVLLDEPTGNLDQHTAHSIQELMLELSQSLRTAFLVVTHDLQLAARCDRCLRLVNGQLQEEA